MSMSKFFTEMELGTYELDLSISNPEGYDLDDIFAAIVVDANANGARTIDIDVTFRGSYSQTDIRSKSRYFSKRYGILISISFKYE